MNFAFCKEHNISPAESTSTMCLSQNIWHFIVEFYEFYIYSEYKDFDRHVYCEYFFPGIQLDFSSLVESLDVQKLLTLMFNF